MTDRLSGANIGKKIVSLSLILSLGSLGMGAVVSRLKKEYSNLEVTTKIEQMVFGTEFALKHLASTLQQQGAYNVEYHDNLVIDTLPENYLYINGKGITFINAIQSKEIIDGKEIINNIIPDGYEQTTTKNGEIIGYKTVEPIKIVVNNCITFDRKKDGIQTTETWQWNQETNKLEKYILTRSVNEDIVTYCNKNNVSLSSLYIYVPGNSTAPKPVRFSETMANTSEIYSKGEKEYISNRIVTFYSEDDINDLANRFSGHLKPGELMIFQKQGEGITTFMIYRQEIKNHNKSL